MVTKALANPESRVLGVLGAGVQARSHIRALTQTRKISEIKVYDIFAESARQLQESLQSEIGVPIEVAPSAREAVRDADLLVTVTTAKEPIVKADWLKPGMHINAVGSHRPDLREIDGATLAAARVVVDSREAIMAECGDILLAIQEKAITTERVHAEICEVLAGKKPGRRLGAGGRRVRELVDEGASVDEVLAAKPTAAFDERYGGAGESTERFVRVLHADLAGRR